MGVPFDHWCAVNPPELHALHPDHPANGKAATGRAGALPGTAARRPRPGTVKVNDKGQNKTSKYGAVATVYDGVRYGSKAEAVRARQLDADRAAGLVTFWYPHPRFRLGVPENVYVADFLVLAPGDELWVEDTKGVETEKFRHNKRLWARYGPCPLRMLRRGKVVEVIVPVIGGIDDGNGS